MRLAGCILAAFGGCVLAGCPAPITPEGRKWLQAAQAAYVRGDDEQAIASSTRFLELHAGIQEAGEAYYLRGLSHARTGRVGAAKADLASALRTTRREDVKALAHAKLGDLAWSARDFEGARTHYEAVLQHTAPGAPPADQAMYRLGCVLQRLGRWRRADHHFDRLIHFFDGSELARRAKTRVRAERWSIQVAAVTDATAATRVREDLRRAGLTSRVDLGLRRDRMHRLVRVGSFATYEAALPELARVRAVCPGAYVVPAR